VLADAILELMKAEGPEATRITATVQEITGRPAGTFADWAKDHRRFFI